MRHLFIIILVTFMPALSTAQVMGFDIHQSEVRFTYYLNNSPMQGRLPLAQAQVALDFEALDNATVRTQLNTRKATAGFIFATQALRGAGMFDAQNHPTATFQSLSIQKTNAGAQIRGNLTIKGITQPVTLTAVQKGPAHQGRVQIDIKGRIDRRDFDMIQYPRLVGPYIDLYIKAIFTAQ